VTEEIAMRKELSIIYRDAEAVLIRTPLRNWEAAPSLLYDLSTGRADNVETLLRGAAKHELSGDIDWQGHEWLPPLTERTEVWAAGVTYYRSREARMEESESTGGDRFYDMVYEAERPELFFKATSWAARGHREKVRIRADSTWNVPEPELALAVNCHGEIFGYSIGNDMSSRSIEGENPLYLPQAKVYRGACALGPGLLVGADALAADAAIAIEIQRGGEAAFTGETDITQIKRGFTELVEFLFREHDFPEGVLLMTGTGLVPDADFTLQSGDVVRITIQGIGTLENEVE